MIYDALNHKYFILFSFLFFLAKQLELLEWRLTSCFFSIESILKIINCKSLSNIIYKSHWMWTLYSMNWCKLCNMKLTANKIYNTKYKIYKIHKLIFRIAISRRFERLMLNADGRVMNQKTRCNHKPTRQM